MSVIAMRALCDDPVGHVLCVRNGAKMIRIYAAARAANVVNEKAVWNGAFMKFVGDAVREKHRSPSWASTNLPVPSIFQ